MRDLARECQPLPSDQPSTGQVAGLLWTLPLDTSALLDCPAGIAVALDDLQAAEAAGAVILRAVHPDGRAFWSPLTRLRLEGRIVVQRSGQRLIVLGFGRWDEEMPSGEIMRATGKPVAAWS